MKATTDLKRARARARRLHIIRRAAIWLFKDAQTRNDSRSDFWGRVVDTCDAALPQADAEISRLGDNAPAC